MANPNPNKTTFGKRGEPYGALLGSVLASPQKVTLQKRGEVTRFIFPANVASRSQFLQFF